MSYQEESLFMSDMAEIFNAMAKRVPDCSKYAIDAKAAMSIFGLFDAVPGGDQMAAKQATKNNLNTLLLDLEGHVRVTASCIEPANQDAADLKACAVRISSVRKGMMQKPLS